MPSGFSSQYTMIEVAKSHGADGRQLAIVDTISFKTPFLEEGYWEEANNFNSHNFQQVLSKPQGTDVRANLGYGWENPVTLPCIAPIQGIAINSRIDTVILSRERDPQGFRAARDLLTISGQKNTVHDRILYGNQTMFPDQISGMWTQFPNLSSGGQMGPSVTDNGGRVANGQSSTYSMKWGPGGAFLVYPRGGRDFIVIKDGGEQLVPDNSTPSKYYWAMVTTFIIQFGLVIEEPRCFQRVANIDTIATWGGTDNAAGPQIAAYSQFPDDNLDGVVTYAPRNVWTQMNQAIERKNNVWLSMEEAWGRRVMHCHGVPIKLCERILPVKHVVGDMNPFTGVAFAAATTLYEPVAS
jgi:hypothetical protein